MSLLRTVILVWVISFKLVFAFQDDLLKTCSQSGFCHRNRQYAKNIRESKKLHYLIDEDSLEFNTNTHNLRGYILKSVQANKKETKVSLPFTLDFIDGDKVRFRLDEDRSNSLDQPGINSRRYNCTETWAFGPDYTPLKQKATLKPPTVFNKKYTLIAGKFTVLLDPNNFRIEVQYNSKDVLTVNADNLLNFEHYRTIEENFENMNEEEEAFNMFKDSFADSKLDTIPFGPESVALDFKFHDISNLYGIPEHADSFKLRDTSKSDPYRLYNVDVFQYNLNSTMPMYGAVPLVIGIEDSMSIGLFWVNPADTWVDIRYEETGSSTHWMSESGIIDFIIIVHETPKLVTESYVNITGKPMLPLLPSIGYHQCRWNYNDEKDILSVDSLMDKWQIPYDFLWLDLEYTDQKRYFTWKPDAFPEPLRMLRKLYTTGRNLVTLIDPHIKTNYHISDSILSAGVAVKNAIQKPFFGQCWPGESLWIDTFSPLANKVWSKFVQTFVSYATNLYIWNDMNEPSIFDGPETTAPKDLIHHEGFEERAVHNLYGLTVHQATYDSYIDMNPNKRPFILTRAFFSGSQRTAATWTGDNLANWGYLQLSIPMILSQNIAGMPVAGADIAGFFGNPDDELLIRWYQAGMWYPFFRAHAHLDTKRREPYLFNEPTRSIVTQYIKLRYQLLPTFYTAFHDSHTRGVPIMNPMIYEHPRVPAFYDLDDQFYLGEQGILVKPVTTPGTDNVSVTFPAGIFYDLHTLKTAHVGLLETKIVPSPIHALPAYIEGGHIITKKEQYRRSSKLMQYDPYTLVIAPNVEGKATGRLYIDDGETFSYKEGQYLDIEMEYTRQALTGKVINKFESSDFNTVTIDKVIIAKYPGEQFGDSCTLQSNGAERDIKIVHDVHSHVVKNLGIKVGEDWKILL